MDLKITLKREDNIPAFGAFLRCEPPNKRKNHVILLNVTGLMWPEVETASGKSVKLSRRERKRLLITTLMHEFGHVLEAELGLPVSEKHIEQACVDWEKFHRKTAKARK